jgi:hypothetical protein
MRPVDRLRTALAGGIPDRVPVMPKIWVDLGAALTGTDLLDVVRDPLTAMRAIARAAVAVGADGARQFLFPPRLLERRGDQVWQVDRAGRGLGRIDMDGGLKTQLEEGSPFALEDPWWAAMHQYWEAEEPFVRSRAQARGIAVPEKRLYEEWGFGDRRRRVMEECGEDLALVGDCGSPTPSFLVSLRGMTRAMFDLVETPELVHAARTSSPWCGPPRSTVATHGTAWRESE